MNDLKIAFDPAKILCLKNKNQCAKTTASSDIYLIDYLKLWIMIWYWIVNWNLCIVVILTMGWLCSWSTCITQKTHAVNYQQGGTPSRTRIESLFKTYRQIKPIHPTILSTFCKVHLKICVGAIRGNEYNYKKNAS